MAVITSQRAEKSWWPEAARNTATATNSGRMICTAGVGFTRLARCRGYGIRGHVLAGTADGRFSAKSLLGKQKGRHETGGYSS